MATAAIFAGALLVSACSSTGDRLDAPQAATGSSPSIASSITQLFSGTSAQASAAAETPTDEIDCPPVDVRRGAATLAVNSAGSDPSVMATRYQGTIVQMARECAVRGTEMTIKAGVQGRLILGPAGGPGQIEIPLRYALVREGPAPKTIWTKLYRIPVSIGEGQANATFTHVEEDMIFPRPKPGEIDAYVVYVGFDTLALEEKKKPAKTGVKSKP